ncbi:MAG: hypothetical protein V3571_13865 [Pseudodesulfovibrio sp.]
MNEDSIKDFDWKEVCALFSIRDSEELEATERERILNRINKMTGEYGREYVIRKIALCNTH